MPSVESIKRDIQSLGATAQEEILNYLEETIVLGSFATEVTNEVKENRSLTEPSDIIGSHNTVVH